MFGLPPANEQTAGRGQEPGPRHTRAGRELQGASPGFQMQVAGGGPGCGGLRHSRDTAPDSPQQGAPPQKLAQLKLWPGLSGGSRPCLGRGHGARCPRLLSLLEPRAGPPRPRGGGHLPCRWARSILVFYCSVGNDHHSQSSLQHPHLLSHSSGGHKSGRAPPGSRAWPVGRPDGLSAGGLGGVGGALGPRFIQLLPGVAGRRFPTGYQLGVPRSHGEASPGPDSLSYFDCPDFLQTNR